MSEIRVLNKRTEGNMFHYAHFLGDCLIPEVVGGLYNYQKVLRPRTLQDTIGVFSKIYEEVMGNKNIELDLDDFNKSKTEIYFPKKIEHLTYSEFNAFRHYVFKKLNIVEDEVHLPSVLLIRRGERVRLIEDEFLERQMAPYFASTGKERREIHRIENLELNLKSKVKNLGVIYLENMSFRDQVRYFKNARYIIGAHGAGLTNMVFCQPGCYILEATFDINFRPFNQYSNILNLNYIKIPTCGPPAILKVFDRVYK